MKFLIVPIIFVCLAIPAFSQDANAQRYKNLSDSMGETVSNSNTQLTDFDKRASYTANGKTYAQYKGRSDSLTKALRESETRTDRLITSRAPASAIKEERDKYEGFIKQLDALKSEYDDWLSSAQ